MAKVVFNGPAGQSFTNSTGKVLYQFKCALDNTCGVCLQYHMAVSTYWPIPLHRNCNCTQNPIGPGQKADPWVDMRDMLKDMPPDQRRAAVGASNFKLLQSGKAKWEDIVTKARVRSFREVVARNRLGPLDLKAAGVNDRIAKNALASVNTPAHKIAAAHKKTLITNLTKAGVSPSQIKTTFAKGQAARVSVQPVGKTVTITIPPKAPKPPATPKPTGAAPFVKKLTNVPYGRKLTGFDISGVEALEKKLASQLAKVKPLGLDQKKVEAAVKAAVPVQPVKVKPGPVPKAKPKPKPAPVVTKTAPVVKPAPKTAAPVPKAPPKPAATPTKPAAPSAPPKGPIIPPKPAAPQTSTQAAKSIASTADEIKRIMAETGLPAGTSYYLGQYVKENPGPVSPANLVLKFGFSPDEANRVAGVINKTPQAVVAPVVAPPVVKPVLDAKYISKQTNLSDWTSGKLAAYAEKHTGVITPAMLVEEFKLSPGMAENVAHVLNGTTAPTVSLPAVPYKPAPPKAAPGTSQSHGSYQQIPPKEVYKWADKHYAKWTKSLTNAEHEAVSEYTADGYAEMNSFLRGQAYNPGSRSISSGSRISTPPWNGRKSPKTSSPSGNSTWRSTSWTPSPSKASTKSRI